MRERFRRQQVKTTMRDGVEREYMPGSVLGGLAVTDYADGVWTITHVASGCLLSCRWAWAIYSKRRGHEIVRILVAGPIDWTAPGAELALNERARDAVDAAWFATERTK